MAGLTSMRSCEGMEVLTYLGSFYTMRLDRKETSLNFRLVRESFLLGGATRGRRGAFVKHAKQRF